MKSFLSLVFYLKTECHSSKTAVISCWIESRYPVRQQQTNKKSSTSMERRAIQPGRDWCQDTFNPLPTAVATTRRKEEEEKEKSIAFIWKHSRMDCEKCDSLYTSRTVSSNQRSATINEVITRTKQGELHWIYVSRWIICSVSHQPANSSSSFSSPCSNYRYDTTWNDDLHSVRRPLTSNRKPS